MKPEDRTPEEWLQNLGMIHDAELPELAELDSLYQGTAPLEYLQPELKRELDGRIWTVSLGWPMLAVDPTEERMDFLGWRYSDDGDNSTEGADLDEVIVSADENLRRVLQDNNLGSESQLGHLDALVMKRAYICVGSNEDDEDIPLVTLESPLEMYADVDPRTRRVRAALRRWTDNVNPLTRLPERYAALYLPNSTHWYEQDSRSVLGWREVDRDEHRLGVAPISPLVNRARLSGRFGQSELTQPLLSLAHAANKLATDMMVAAEFHALPLRAIFGIGPEDLVDENGDRISALQAIMGKMLAIPDVDGSAVKAHQFDPSSLTNFHDSLNQLAKHTAGLLGLDPHVFGFTTDNPASAEALKARETRQVNRVERKINTFNSSWKWTAQLVRRFQEGSWDPRAKRIETIWRDPATPTRASAADAAVKLFSGGIVPRRQTWEDLGYSPGAQRRMQAELDAQAEADPIGQMTRALAQQPSPAEQLVDEQSTGAAQVKPVVE